MSYRRYAAERIAASLAVLFLAASLAYVIVHLVGPGQAKPTFQPGDAIDVVRRVNYVHYRHETYPGFLWRLVGHGSLGHDLRGRDLTSLTFGSAPVTLSLSAGAIVFALLVGVPLGVLWARRRLGRLVAAPFALLGVSVFPVGVWFYLSFYLSYRANAFPVAGYCNLFGSGGCSGPVQWSYHLVVPSIVLGVALAAVYAGVTRRLTLALDRSEDDRAAARRGAVIAFGKLLVRNASWLVGATFLVEILFQLEGLGRQLLLGYNLGDPPIIEATLIAATIVAVGLSLAVDLVAGAFLPEWRVNEFQQRLASGPDSSARAVSGV